MRIVIDISGLNKAKLLAALYNAASPMGMGFLQYDKTPMTPEEAEKILAKTKHFDYLLGRPLKLSLDEELTLDAGLYDRDQGSGAAQKVVDELRRTGDVNTHAIQQKHAYSKLGAAGDAMELAATRTVIDKSQGGVTSVTLGADNLSEPLKVAVKKALT